MAESPAPPKPRVLVVDDEPDFLEFVQWQLETLGYDARTAESGEAAVAQMDEGAVDVLLADLRMPGMDGIELIRQTALRHPDAQCIVVTGHGGVESAVAAMRLGAVNYLRKPVGVEELDVAIQKALEKADLLRRLRERQRELEAANAELAEKNRELERLRKELQAALETESQGRQAAEAELARTRLRECAVEVMALSLQYWRQTTRKGKVVLAEESGIWTATLEHGGSYRTRTLDRYLRLQTLPPNPRFADVMDTAHFVLGRCNGDGTLRSRLETRVAELEQMVRTVS
jgi:FixJ family two-component response regulator